MMSIVYWISPGQRSFAQKATELIFEFVVKNYYYGVSR